MTLAALLVTLAVAALFAGTATAHEYSSVRYWDTGEVMPETTNVDTRYATQIRKAAADYPRNAVRSVHSYMR